MHISTVVGPGDQEFSVWPNDLFITSIIIKYNINFARIVSTFKIIIGGIEISLQLVKFLVPVVKQEKRR